MYSLDIKTSFRSVVDLHGACSFIVDRFSSLSTEISRVTRDLDVYFLVNGIFNDVPNTPAFRVCSTAGQIHSSGNDTFHRVYVMHVHVPSTGTRVILGVFTVSRYVS